MPNTLKKSCRDVSHQLLAAIEFKLITKSLGKDMETEVGRDFQKLTWAIESGQVDNVYLIIFNRARKEDSFIKELQNLKKRYPEVKGIYLESIVTSHKRYYSTLYLNEADWKYKVKIKG